MRWILVVALLGCGKHAEPPPPPTLDHAQVYPLIVVAQDLPTGPVRRPLVDGLVVTLAADEHGKAKLLREPDLQGWALDDAYTTALANLDRAAHDIHINGEIGVDGHTQDVVWGHDWRAAACLLLPGVRQLAAQTFHEPLYAMIPNRDVLVMFGDRSLAGTVLKAEPGGEHKLTPRLLQVVPGDRPFWVKSPVAWAD